MLGARERVQSNLLEYIKEGLYEEMFREDLSRCFPLIPSANLALPLGAKRPRMRSSSLNSYLKCEGGSESWPMLAELVSGRGRETRCSSRASGISSSPYGRSAPVGASRSTTIAKRGC